MEKENERKRERKRDSSLLFWVVVSAVFVSDVADFVTAVDAAAICRVANGAFRFGRSKEGNQPDHVRLALGQQSYHNMTASGLVS